MVFFSSLVRVTILGLVFALGTNSFAIAPECLKYLLGNGEPLVVEQSERNKLIPLMNLLRSIAKPPEVTWPSDTISPQKIATPERAIVLAGMLADPNSTLNQELTSYIGFHGGRQSQSLWNVYLQSYDRLIGFIPNFQDLGIVMSAILPRDDVVGDFGAGAGAISAMLAFLAPRDLWLRDFSPTGLEIAEAKLKAIAEGERFLRHRFKQSDITISSDAHNSLSGAVVNNVIYTLGDKKLAALKNIFNALRPGAYFILNDVVRSVQKNPDQIRKFLFGAVMGALQNGAPATEFDLVLVGRINMQYLLDDAAEALEPGQLLELAQRAGFQVISHFSSYGGISYFIVLQKPG